LKHPELFWDPPCLMFSGYSGTLSLRVKHLRHEADRPYVMPRLRMTGAVNFTSSYAPHTVHGDDFTDIPMRLHHANT